jgi:hypothetical protein
MGLVVAQFGPAGRVRADDAGSAAMQHGDGRIAAFMWAENPLAFALKQKRGFANAFILIGFAIIDTGGGLCGRRKGAVGGHTIRRV